jgi:CDP-diacylglycerol--serine O-phosphatidyltransferase
MPDDNVKSSTHLSGRTQERIFIVALRWPDLISLAGLFFSLLSLPLMLGGRFELSLSALLIAMALDFVDGAMARKYDLCRDFGRYLDGFIDTVDYLVAPALFLYMRGFNEWFYLFVLFIFIAAGFVRLSVFNEIGNIVTASGASGYLGLPVYWSLFILAVFQAASWVFDVQQLLTIVAIVLIVMSVLMVYRVSFFKFQSWQGVCAFSAVCALGFAVRGTLLN